jgi:hypothetical protein
LAVIFLTAPDPAIHFSARSECSQKLLHCFPQLLILEIPPAINAELELAGDPADSAIAVVEAGAIPFALLVGIHTHENKGYIVGDHSFQGQLWWTKLIQ